MVSAWASEAQVVLGQRKVADKSNEMTAIPQLLDVLALEGCIVTIDAIGTQTKIAECIVDRGADYVLAVKANQATLLDDVRLCIPRRSSPRLSGLTVRLCQNGEQGPWTA